MGEGSLCLGVEMGWKLCLKEAETFKYLEVTVFPGFGMSPQSQRKDVKWGQCLVV